VLLQGSKVTRLLAREQIALPPAIDADRLKEHHAALDVLGQIANQVVGFADIQSFHNVRRFGD
jgi:hypothetical protein